MGGIELHSRYIYKYNTGADVTLVQVLRVLASLPLLTPPKGLRDASLRTTAEL